MKRRKRHSEIWLTTFRMMIVKHVDDILERIGRFLGRALASDEFELSIYKRRIKSQTENKNFMLHLCRIFELGPSHPKPDAIVLISTIATQQ